VVKRIVLASALLTACLPAWAVDAVLRSDVRELQVGQSAWVSVSVIDANPQDTPVLTAPTGLRVQFERTESSRNTQIANGRFVVQRTINFVYRVTALQEGSYELGPLQVHTDAGDATTAALTLQVSARAAEVTERIAVDAGFDRDQVWEGEVVVYHYQVRARGRVLRSQWNLPTFEGLTPPRDGDHPRREGVIDDPAGAIQVDETWVPLVVTGTGALDQTPAVVRVDVAAQTARQDPFRDPFGMFARSEPLVMASEAAPLNARALPTPPQGFSGLVGDFELTGSVRSTDVTVGESVVWSVRVVGDGTLEGFSLPPVTDLDGAQVYDNGPTVGARVVDGAYRAEGRFERVVVPTREGEVVLPSVDVVIFSPTAGAYVTKRIEGATLQVQPGREGDAKVESFAFLGGGGPKARAAEDIRDPWRSGGSSAWLPGWGWFAGLAVLFALPGLGVVVRAVLQRLLEERAKRQRVTKPTLAQRLASLPSAGDARAAALEDILREAKQRCPGTPTAVALDELLASVARARFGGRDLDERVVTQAGELLVTVEEA